MKQLRVWGLGTQAQQLRWGGALGTTAEFPGQWRQTNDVKRVEGHTITRARADGRGSLETEDN